MDADTDILLAHFVRNGNPLKGKRTDKPTDRLLRGEIKKNPSELRLFDGNKASTFDKMRQVSDITR